MCDLKAGKVNKNVYLGCKNLDDLARSGRPKIVDYETVPHAIEPNPVSNTQRVSESHRPSRSLQKYLDLPNCTSHYLKSGIPKQFSEPFSLIRLLILREYQDTSESQIFTISAKVSGLAEVYLKLPKYCKTFD